MLKKSLVLHKGGRSGKVADMAEEPQGAGPSTQADTAEKTPVYEVSFHLVPTLPEDGAAAVVDKIRKVLATPKTGESAEIIAEGSPQRMHLAYVVERAAQGKREKYSEAYFGWIKFAPAGQAALREIPQALAEELRAMPEVLRYLIVETVREDISARLVRAVFTSDRLEGQTLKKPASAPEKSGEVSEEELDKSIEALVAPDL